MFDEFFSIKKEKKNILNKTAIDLAQKYRISCLIKNKKFEKLINGWSNITLFTVARPDVPNVDVL